MILVYTKEGCTHCDSLKSELTSRSIEYLDYEIGKDVSREWFKENYPGATMLPVVVTDTEVYSGPNEIQKLLSEYKSEVGKRLLNE